MVRGAQYLEALWIGKTRVSKESFAFEMPVSQGRLGVEFALPGFNDYALVWEKFKLGRRTEFALDQINTRAMAVIKFKSAPVFKSFQINGYLLKAPATSLDHLFLEPGQYSIELELQNGKRYEHNLRMVAGQTLAMSDFETLFVRTNGSNASFTSKRVLQYSLMALGLGVTAYGGLEALNASDERSAIESSPGEYTRADAKRDWDSASNAGNQGLLVGSLGLTTFATSLVWLLLTEPADTTLYSGADGIRGGDAPARTFADTYQWRQR